MKDPPFRIIYEPAAALQVQRERVWLCNNRGRERADAFEDDLAHFLELATKDNLSTLDVIHRLCDEEKQSRLRSAVDRRLREARFPEINTIDSFNFDFDPGRKKIRARYLALHDLAFLAKGINPLFIGVPGTGSCSIPVDRPSCSCSIPLVPRAPAQSLSPERSCANCGSPPVDKRS